MTTASFCPICAFESASNPHLASAATEALPCPHSLESGKTGTPVARNNADPSMPFMPSVQSPQSQQPQQPRVSLPSPRLSFSGPSGDPSTSAKRQSLSNIRHPRHMDSQEWPSPSFHPAWSSFSEPSFSPRSFPASGNINPVGVGGSANPSASSNSTTVPATVPWSPSLTGIDEFALGPPQIDPPTTSYKTIKNAKSDNLAYVKGIGEPAMSFGDNPYQNYGSMGAANSMARRPSADDMHAWRTSAAGTAQSVPVSPALLASPRGLIPADSIWSTNHASAPSSRASTAQIDRRSSTPNLSFNPMPGDYDPSLLPPLPPSAKPPSHHSTLSQQRRSATPSPRVFSVMAAVPPPMSLPSASVPFSPATQPPNGTSAIAGSASGFGHLTQRINTGYSSPSNLKPQIYPAPRNMAASPHSLASNPVSPDGALHYKPDYAKSSTMPGPGFSPRFGPTIVSSPHALESSGHVPGMQLPPSPSLHPYAAGVGAPYPDQRQPSVNPQSAYRTSNPSAVFAEYIAQEDRKRQLDYQNFVQTRRESLGQTYFDATSQALSAAAIEAIVRSGVSFSVPTPVPSHLSSPSLGPTMTYTPVPAHGQAKRNSKPQLPVPVSLSSGEKRGSDRTEPTADKVAQKSAIELLWEQYADKLSDAGKPNKAGATDRTHNADGVHDVDSNNKDFKVPRTAGADSVLKVAESSHRDPIVVPVGGEPITPDPALDLISPLSDALDRAALSVHDRAQPASADGSVPPASDHHKNMEPSRERDVEGILDRTPPADHLLSDSEATADDNFGETDLSRDGQPPGSYLSDVTEPASSDKPVTDEKVPSDQTEDESVLIVAADEAPTDTTLPRSRCSDTSPKNVGSPVQTALHEDALDVFQDDSLSPPPESYSCRSSLELPDRLHRDPDEPFEGSASATAEPVPGETPATELRIFKEIQTSKLKVDEKKLTIEYFNQLTKETEELCDSVCFEPFPVVQREFSYRTLSTPVPGASAAHSRASSQASESRTLGVRTMGKVVHQSFEDQQWRASVTLVKILETLLADHFENLQILSLPLKTLEFTLKGEDIELGLVYDNKGTLSPVQIIEQIGHALKAAGLKEVKMLTRTRVPIVKFKDPVSGIRCEMGIQNRGAAKSYELVKTYAMIDDRFKYLVLVVKYWAKMRSLNEPHFGTLSSYCYILMIIHFFQIRGIFPCLQQLQQQPEVPESGSESSSAEYFSDLEQLSSIWSSSNTESLGELVVAFFKYYSAEFPYVHGVASVRFGKVLSKEDKGWTKERQQEARRAGSIKDRFWLCVEDPFDPNLNVGQPIDKETLFDVRGEFIRGSKILCTSGGTGDHVFSKLCEQVPKSPKQKKK